MCRELIRNQLERIVKARTGVEGYDYFASVEALALLLPDGLTQLAMGYKAKHGIKTILEIDKERIDEWFLFIKGLITKNMSLDIWV